MIKCLKPYWLRHVVKKVEIPPYTPPTLALLLEFIPNCVTSKQTVLNFSKQYVNYNKNIHDIYSIYSNKRPGHKLEYPLRIQRGWAVIIVVFNDHVVYMMAGLFSTQEGGH